MTLIQNNHSSLVATLLAACVVGLGLGACDLPPKDIGKETTADDGADGGADDGGTCEEGDTKPADDGCNTCYCDENGAWGCTEIGCVDGGDDVGGECTPGDTMPAPDGCNTCGCTDEGLWACTLLGCPGDSDGGSECVPGDTMPAPDGCNTCDCTDDGLWACSEMGCEALPICADPVDSDPFGVVAAEVVGDALQVTVGYSGGCAEHAFDLCWSGDWLESLPVQTGLTIAHTDPGDPCDAAPTEERTFDLLPLQQQYVASYGSGGTISIHLDGWPTTLSYSF